MREVLDLGAGSFPYQPKPDERVTYVDCRAGVFASRYYDSLRGGSHTFVEHALRQTPWPFATDSAFDHLRSSHVLEHLQPAERMAFMGELWRVGKPGATVDIRVPHFSGVGAFADMTHAIGGFSSHAFYAFSTNSRNRSKLGPCDVQLPVDRVRLLWTRFPKNPLAWIMNRFWSSLSNLNVPVCERIWCRMFPVGGFSELCVVMRVEKSKATTNQDLKTCSGACADGKPC